MTNNVYPAKTILTIAIPTYNRARYLEQQLIRLQAQNNERICILISDNASSDSTMEIAQHYSREIPNLVYMRNPTNLGFDQNVLQCYLHATTKYIWFLSDDDLVQPNAITTILIFLDSHDPTVAVFGFDTIGESHQAVHVEKIFSSLDEVADYTWFQRTIFISALLVQKMPLITRGQLEKLLGSNFFQLSLSLVLLSQRFVFCIEPGILVVTRDPGYVTRREISELWFVGPAKAMLLPEYGYNPTQVNKCVRRAWKPFLVLLKSAKVGVYQINPHLSAKTAKDLEMLLGKDFLLWVRFALAVYSITPAWLVKTYHWLKCVKAYGFAKGKELYQLDTQRASNALKDSDF
jgi:hypothetical protein